jgi:hypothetical protein
MPQFCVPLTATTEIIDRYLREAKRWARMANRATSDHEREWHRLHAILLYRVAVRWAQAS